MFESATYEVIKQNIIDNLSIDIDKREGSIVNDIISPIAVEMAKNYLDLEFILKNAFAMSAAGEYLDKRANEFGVYRKDGVKAKTTLKFTGVEGSIIPIGTRVATDGDLGFLTTAQGKIVGNSADVTAEAEDVGKLYNVPANTLTIMPVVVLGITGVTNTLDISNGYDIESDVDLLNRLLLHVQTPATSGNANHYKLWALDVKGVGDAKVTPLWNGAGTVKVLVVDSNKAPANAQLQNDVTAYIEDMRPIGATVTVTTALPHNVSVECTSVLEDGAVLNDVKNEFTDKVKQYLKDITFKQGYVSYAQIGSLLLQTKGVADYSSLKINGGTSNVILGADDVPILSNVTMGV